MNDEVRRELEHYMHALAHDLQSNVGKIVTISEYLVEKAAGLDAAERDYLNRMNEAAWQLKQQIDDLTRGETERFKSLKP